MTSDNDQETDHKTSQNLGKSVFYLKQTHDAAQTNRQILSAFNGKLGAEIEAQTGSPLDCGSEFMDINGIKNLFCIHKYKERIVYIIQKGLHYHLSPIENATQKLDPEAMLLRENHKLARSELNSAAPEKAIDKGVEHGWALILTIDSLRHIENVGVVPLGVAEQLTIYEKGERYTKRRVTHDCSFPGPSGQSVNNRVLKDTLQPCFYGFCLLRILHMISAMRIKWPSKRILIEKIDLDAAYQYV